MNFIAIDFPFLLTTFTHTLWSVFFSTSTATHSIATRNFLSSSIFYVFIFLKKKSFLFLRKKINQIRPICVFVVLYSIETVYLRTHTYLFSLLGASYICKMSYCTEICEPPNSSYNQ